MVCYAVPAVAAIIHHILRKNVTSLEKSTSHFWLSLLLAGGAIFGIIDHLWNGELFLLGEEPLIDILLGVTITVVIIIVWGALAILEKSKLYKPSKINH